MVQTVPQIELGILGGRQVIGDFEGGDIATYGGAMLVAEADRKLGLTEKLAVCRGPVPIWPANRRCRVRTLCVLSGELGGAKRTVSHE